MNIKGLPLQAVTVPPSESAPLIARQKAKRRLLDEQAAAQARADAERDARVRAAADEGWRRLCATPTPPANVTRIEEFRR